MNICFYISIFYPVIFPPACYSLNVREDIYLKLDGKIYSKLTTTEININQVDKYIDNEYNYYYIYYGFKLKQYPLIINDINDIEHKYITNPKLEDILNPVNNYDLKKIENFQIWNKYGKIIFNNE